MGQITKMGDRITELLEKYPSYRATKYKCIAHVLWHELPKELRTKETKAVLVLIAESRLPATETISRSWRKVMELHPAWKQPDLEKIKRKQQEDIKNELRMLGGLEKL